MQNLRRMDNVVIGEYYLMKIMDEDVNWMKLTHMLSVLSLHLTPPFCTPTFTSKKYSLHLSLIYTMHNNASNNTPFYTLISSYVF